MTTSRSTRRARRGTLVRTAGWLSAAAMLATAAFAPASVSAANPSAMDVACNNIVHGGPSPEYVWTTVDDAGVTANWATDAAHFDSATYDTVTIRVCVVDADGADQGGIDGRILKCECDTETDTGRGLRSDARCEADTSSERVELELDRFGLVVHGNPF